MTKLYKQNNIVRPILFAIGLLFFTCQEQTKPNDDVTLVHVNQSEPNIHKTKDGLVLMSFIETDTTDQSTLKWSRLQEDNSWSEPKTITTGSDWFVNWADFPSLSSFGSNVTSHYLEKSANDTYAYDVKVITSNDLGKTWNEPFTIHNDSTNTEHGFVSKVALDDNNMFHTWLDGRKYAYAKKDSTLVEEMTLRAAIFNSENNITVEYELDPRVCDCCQTATALTKDGPIVTYRDRSAEEIRDIYFTKFNNGTWSTPKAIYDDAWHIEGCPVNGPAIDAANETVAVAWYSAANATPSIKVAFSTNSGNSFNDPIQVDHTSTLGRVDLKIIDNKTALACWMDKRNDTTAIVLQKIGSDGRKSAVFKATGTSSSRSSGFPRMVINDSDVILVHTMFDEVTKRSEVKTHIIPLDRIE